MSKIYKIFAYGSLINQQSLTRTVPEARNITPVKTRGLQRVFNLASTYRYDEQHQAAVCVLNAEDAEPEQVMNGTCFEMDEQSLDRLLEREKGYDFCRITACHYHDEADIFDAYYFKARDFEPYRYLSASKAQAHYLNLCLSGCAVFGQPFVDDFIGSTSFWDVDEEGQKSIWQGHF
ncbi:gamma-glutamylcyclotransferase family protein [Methylobacter sp. sgz302048]|uniref:gamma-glutamylcyclotransferase family protein n=1 Tax=Methylobacter sp. sgz302048 TaxID=3455945 RepID=UPI003FA01AC0